MPILSSSSSVYSLTPRFSSLISFSFIIVSIFLSLDCLSFHYLQFLSNLFQYSWLYYLSNHLNNFLAMNLPGNSPLLNVPFLCFYFVTSFMSQRYFFLNSLIAFCVFSKFSLLFYVSDSTVNPFQHTKYLFFSLTCHLFNILSTSYSFFSLIITGASHFFFCPFTYSIYLHILLIFTTGCIFTILGSSNSTIFDNTIFLTL